MSDPLRHAWSLPTLRGRSRCPASTSRSVGKPLALDPHDGQIGAGAVANTNRHAVAVPEVEFGQIAVKMDLGNMLVDAIDAALEDREVPLGGVGVGVPPGRTPWHGG